MVPTILWHIYHSPHLVVICKLAEGMLFPAVQIISTDTTVDWAQYLSLEYTTSYWFPRKFCATDQLSLGSAIQLLFNLSQ